MDIEDLSKTQLLLLTILVNFVVAIATGVLTVSLLDEAPTTVTQTVNRIVDHTIETVTTQVPVGGGGQSHAPSTEDLLTNAIAINASRTVSIRTASAGEVIGRGFYIVSAKGIVSTNQGLPKRVFVAFPDGSIFPADLSRQDGSISVFVFEPDTTLPAALSTEFTASGDLKQGQSVIALLSDGSASTGIITKIDADGVHTNLPTLPASSVALTLSGNIAGMTAGTSTLIPAEIISASLTQGTP